MGSEFSEGRGECLFWLNFARCLYFEANRWEGKVSSLILG
jgi:hypothetical protein